MKIYVCHSSSYDYQNNLYLPLKSAIFWHKHCWVLPHEQDSAPNYSKQLIKDADLVIAEVSYPSTGMGIELGWADQMQRNLLCLYQETAIISSSLHLICKDFLIYTNQTDMINQLAAKL